MAVTSNQKHTPGSMVELLGKGERVPDLYARAYKDGKNFSGWLDEEIGFDKDRGLDGFDQCMMELGIRVNSKPDKGLWSSGCDVFFDNEAARALFPEFVARQWRKVSMAFTPKTRGTDIYMSSDLNALLSGVWGAAQGELRVPALEPSIPLDSLIAITTGVTGTTTYEALYLTDDATQYRLVRIAETAEIPRAKITAGKTSIRLHKYGRALEISYEEMRRMRVDRLAFHVQRIAVQSEIDKIATVADVIINGDGNANPATSTNISTLDAAATGGAVTVLGWLAWKLKWNALSAYRLTTILLQEGSALKLLTLSMGNANIPLVTLQAQAGFGALQPMRNQLGDSVEYGITTEVGATQIVGLDARQAIERVFEIGGNISEVARFVTRQTQVMTMTEVEGYAKIDSQATRILNLA